jgi:hypothetical protein
MQMNLFYELRKEERELQGMIDRLKFEYATEWKEI